MAKKRKKTSGRTAWRKKFGKAVVACHRDTTTKDAFGKCMKRNLKK